MLMILTIRSRPDLVCAFAFAANAFSVAATDGRPDLLRQRIHSFAQLLVIFALHVIARALANLAVSAFVARALAAFESPVPCELRQSSA